MKDGRQAWFLFLEDGEDPDSTVQSIGKPAFEQLIAEAQPLSEFLFSHAGLNIDLQTIDGRARLTKLALPLLQQLPEGAFRQLMESELARRTGLSHADVASMASDAADTQPSVAANTTPAAPTDGYMHQVDYESADALQSQRPRQRSQLSSVKNSRLSNMGKATAILMFNPELAAQIDISRPTLDEDIHSELFFELLGVLRDQPQLSSLSLIGHWINSSEAKREAATALLAVENLLPTHNRLAELTDTLNDHLARTTAQSIKTELDELGRRATSGLNDADKARYRELLSQLPTKSQ